MSNPNLAVALIRINGIIEPGAFCTGSDEQLLELTEAGVVREPTEAELALHNQHGLDATDINDVTMPASTFVAPGTVVLAPTAPAVDTSAIIEAAEGEANDIVDAATTKAGEIANAAQAAADKLAADAKAAADKALADAQAEAAKIVEAAKAAAATKPAKGAKPAGEDSVIG